MIAGIVLALLAVMVLVVPGVAQTAGSGTGSSASKSSGGVPQAPVGHRQPTKAEVSGGGSQNSNGLLGAAAADDKELDRKIKSICKGC
jgi:hypothetical protein